MLGDRLLRDMDLLGPSESEQKSAQCTHNSRGYGRKDEAAAILSDNLDLRSRRSKLDNSFTYKQQQQQQQKQINFFLTISKTTITLKNDNNNKALVANIMDWMSRNGKI